MLKDKGIPEIHSNNLIALLDLTKERVLDRRASENNSDQQMKVIEDPLEIDTSQDQDFSSVSSASINEISKNGILDQIAEIKELFKNQSNLLDNFKHDLNHSPKSPKSPKSPLSPNGSRDFLRPRLGSKEFIPRMREGISSIESVFAKAISENNEEEYSVIASTLLGIGQRHSVKHSEENTQPLLRFLKRRKKRMGFRNQAFLVSHLNMLNI